MEGPCDPMLPGHRRRKQILQILHLGYALSLTKAHNSVVSATRGKHANRATRTRREAEVALRRSLNAVFALYETGLRYDGYGGGRSAGD
jgi:hypothetical protein